MSRAMLALPGQEPRPRETPGSVQLVSFRLAEEEYALEITKVQEIILVGQVTRVPRTPDYIRGLINLRSTVIPIIDLRRRFGLPDQPASDQQRIVVVNVAGKTTGIVVDAVNEVIRMNRDQIVPPPPVVAGLGRDYLVGLARLDHRLLILLDIEKILLENASDPPPLDSHVSHDGDRSIPGSTA